MNPHYALDLPASEYHARTELSAHQLMEMRKSPKHFKDCIENPQKPTPAMEMGTVVHSLALEGGKDIAIMPEGMTRRGKAGEEFKAINEGRTILSFNEAAEAKAYSSALLANADIAKVISESQHEVSLFWHDDEYDVDMRARIDMLRIWKSLSLGKVNDIKTCENASLETMEREIFFRNYDMQGFIHCRGVKAVFGVTDATFTIDCVEKSAPYVTVSYELDELFMKSGEQKFREAMEKYVAARKTNNWTGYASGKISPSAWMLKQLGL